MPQIRVFFFFEDRGVRIEDVTTTFSSQRAFIIIRKLFSGRQCLTKSG